MNHQYYDAIRKVYENGVPNCPRKMHVRELYNYIFTLNPPLHPVSTLEGFQTNLEYAKKETEWYRSGSNKIADMGKFAHIWEKYSDDGIHCNSAYGQYIFPYQWNWVVAKFKEDSNTRQAIININQPMHKENPTKDFPCCICMNFYINEYGLNLTTVFRSQDVNTGLRNDIYTMIMLQQDMANQLKLDIGVYTNISLNLHIYEKDYKKAERLLYGS